MAQEGEQGGVKEGENDMRVVMSDIEYIGKKKLDLIVREMIARQNAREANENLFFVKNNISLEYCADFSETDDYGNKHVYIWLDKKNKAIYIGQGNLGRIVEKHTNIVNYETDSSKYEIYLIAKNVDGIRIRYVETSLIAYACLLNVKLINAKDILAEEDVLQFRKKYVACSNGRDKIEYPFPIRDDYYKYKEVFDMFDMFVNDKLSVSREKELTTVDFEYANYFPPYEYAPHWMTIKTWTINGVTKTISEWTEEYDISYTTVTNRMKKYNIPLEKAISLPKAKKNTGYSVLEQWQQEELM